MNNQTRPRVCFWDIETLPNVVAAFGMWEQNININAIIENSSMICASWKFQGDKNVYSRSILDYPNYEKSVFDDKALVRDVAKVLLDADVLVHHNGDSFDVKYLNTRLLANGFKSLPKIQTVDTYKVAKSKFRLNSNKLDYLAQTLGLEGKIKVGMELWMRIIKGDRKAVKEMQEYNRRDVEVLENVYNKLISFVPTHPNFNLYQAEGAEPCCPSCGSDKLVKRGYSLSRVGRRQRFRCTDCGSWSVGGKSINIVDVRGV